MFRGVFKLMMGLNKEECSQYLLDKFVNQACSLRLYVPVFLKSLLFVRRYVCLCVCLFVCPSRRILITSGVIGVI